MILVKGIIVNVVLLKLEVPTSHVALYLKKDRNPGDRKSKNKTRIREKSCTDNVAVFCNDEGSLCGRRRCMLELTIGGNYL